MPKYDSRKGAKAQKMKRIQTKLGRTFITLAAMAAVAADAAAADIKLRERVVPKSSVVRLGDVAEISSADRQQARQLAAVPLMPAPAPDTERFLRQREIADMLAANGVELADIRFGGAEQVAVGAQAGVQMAAAFEVSSESVTSGNRHAAVLAGGTAKAAPQQLDEAQTKEMRERFGRIVSEYLKSKTGKADTRINYKLTHRQLAQLAAATSAPVCEGGSEPWTGRQKLIVSFATAGGAVHVPVHLDVAESAVVATRSVARGGVITAADVEVQQLEPGSKTSQRVAVESIETIIGMEARQAIQAGQVVYADQVQSPVLVKKGDSITVVSQNGGIRVRTSAKALQDGANGALVEVESTESKQRFDARVIGLREAAVFAPTRVAAPEPAQSTQMARRPMKASK
jgi:flagella basal body P-ring formation protein FlgA